MMSIRFLVAAVIACSWFSACAQIEGDLPEGLDASVHVNFSDPEVVILSGAFNKLLLRAEPSRKNGDKYGLPIGEFNISLFEWIDGGYTKLWQSTVDRWFPLAFAVDESSNSVVAIGRHSLSFSSGKEQTPLLFFNSEGYLEYELDLQPIIDSYFQGRDGESKKRRVDYGEFVLKKDQLYFSVTRGVLLRLSLGDSIISAAKFEDFLIEGL